MLTNTKAPFFAFTFLGSELFLSHQLAPFPHRSGKRKPSLWASVNFHVFSKLWLPSFILFLSVKYFTVWTVHSISKCYQSLKKHVHLNPNSVKHWAGSRKNGSFYLGVGIWKSFQRQRLKLLSRSGKRHFR